MYICESSDISKVERLVMRRELEKMYCDSMAIYQKMEITDPKTHVTSFKDVITKANIPCRVSEQNISSASTDEPARAGKHIKVILAPEIVIPPGCSILVSYHGHTGRFKQSGEPYYKSDTQTIELEFEDYA